MSDKVRCPKCDSKRVRTSRAVFNKDGSKHTHHPLIYFGLLFGLGIVITFRFNQEWHILVGSICAVITVAVTAYFAIQRRGLPAGYEYNCQNCEHQWFKQDAELQKS